MYSWLENRARVCEAILLGSVVVLIVVIVDNYFGFSSSLQICGPSSGFQFGYRRRNGPAKWKEHYENAQGQMQSPINIVTCNAVMKCVEPLEWSHHDRIPEMMVMYNDGYSVAIQGVWKCEKPQITGEALDHVNYVFNRLYFHWGPIDTEGSEHTINYERYPLELHAIYLKEGFATPMDAHNENCPNGMLIVAFLFEITPVDNPSFLRTVTESLYKIKHPKSRCYIEPFPLNDIFPEFSDSYFKYDGSVTQPPCSEIVKYIIQTETIAVSRRQMAMFRKLIAFDGKAMVNNSRPVQKLNGRTVYYCCPSSEGLRGLNSWSNAAELGQGSEEYLRTIHLHESDHVQLRAPGRVKPPKDRWNRPQSRVHANMVTAMHMLNNDVNPKALPGVQCTESCQSKTKMPSSPQSKWNYGYGISDGPHMWHTKSRTCGGRRQSPIDLDTTASVIKYSPHLYWWNYNRKPRKMTLKNNGHSIMLKGEWDSAEVPALWLSAGNQSAKDENFVFEQLHFHWGSNRSVGSEHTVNSLSYPMEMHVVHHKRKYRDMYEALDAGRNNVLVVAVLFKISKHENEGLAPLVSALKNLRSAGGQSQEKPFEIRRLLPEFSNYFLMYNGSLTMPPCSEGITWVVKLETSTVSLTQLAEFQLLKNDKNESLSNNYRPVQPLNGRSVWHIK